jgi:hypothetical protein
MSHADDSNERSDDGNRASPSNRMSERVAGGRFGSWLLMRANREVVAALFVFVVFVALAGLSLIDPVALRITTASADPVETLFQALTGAIITGVTLVVTLTQLVLSQELGPVGDQRERMEGAMAFREDAEETLGVPVAPPEPSAFLRALLAASQERAQELADAATGESDGHAAARRYASGVIQNAKQVQGELEDAQFGTFDVIGAALDYNYSWKIYEARKLRSEHGEALAGDAFAAIDALLDVLRLFGPAREHFKTLYFEWDLVNLSRAMIYSAIPALVVAIGSVLFLGSPQHVVSTTLGVHDLAWVVSAAVAVAVVPFGLLLSYMLRIATVAQHTLAIGPFVLRETDRTADVD